MAKTFTILGIVVLAAAAWVLIRAALLPNDFRLSRSVTIRAPREKIFALINDMKAFNQWNPFAKMDPSTQSTYRGPGSGPGAAFEWTQAPGRRDKAAWPLWMWPHRRQLP
jgi:hypothetical protein